LNIIIIFFNFISFGRDFLYHFENLGRDFVVTLECAIILSEEM